MKSNQRLDIQGVDPKAYQLLLAVEKHVHAGALGPALISLVKFRASQINGCAYCLDMHGHEARAAGVAQRKLDVLAGWHEAPALYTEREQAALALTEEVTRIGEHGVLDQTWAQVRAMFNEEETALLLMVICAINVWNRLAVAVRRDLPPARS